MNSASKIGKTARVIAKKQDICHLGKYCTFNNFKNFAAKKLILP